MRLPGVTNKIISLVDRITSQGARMGCRGPLKENLKYLLPKGAVNPEGRIRAEFVHPFMEHFIGAHQIENISPEKLIAEFEQAGIIEPPAAPKPEEKVAFNAMVWIRAMEVEKEIDDEYRGKFEALVTALHDLQALEKTEAQQHMAVIDAVIKTLKYDMLYSYVMDSREGTWRRDFSFGEKVVSRFADIPGKPNEREEKGFLTKLLRGEISEEQIKQDIALGLYEYHVNGKWGYFYIPDRSKCYFIDPERIGADKRAYGPEAAQDVLFLFMGDTGKEERRVYQIANWTRGEPVFKNKKEDLKLLHALAEALALAEENRELNNRNIELSLIDGLTQIYNRKAFEEKMLLEVARVKRFGSPLSLIMIDIDNFKKLNDRYGHPFGDDVLKKVAEMIKKTVRETDIVSRYGGEEIAVILPQTNGKGESAAVVAEKIRKAIAEMVFMFGTERVPVTISLGVGTLRPEDVPQDENIDSQKANLIGRSDAALYAAKRGEFNKGNLGKNQVVVYLSKESFLYLYQAP